MNEIYNKIKAIRVSKGLTQNEVDEKIGMAQSNYGQLEKGLIQVPIERLEQLSDIFDMSVGNILNYEGNLTIEKADVDFLRNEVIRLQKLQIPRHIYSLYQFEKGLRGIKLIQEGTKPKRNFDI